MKQVIAILLALLMVSCGYQLGGFKRSSLKGVDSFCVRMFENNTTFSNVSMQLTTAITDNLQRDGTYKLASPTDADVVLMGRVLSVQAGSLRTNWSDTYLSSEIGLTIVVYYSVVNTRTGKRLAGGEVKAEGSYFNSGNVQTARDSALSYAARRAAELIVQALTTP